MMVVRSFFIAASYFLQHNSVSPSLGRKLQHLAKLTVFVTCKNSSQQISTTLARIVERVRPQLAYSNFKICLSSAPLKHLVQRGEKGQLHHRAIAGKIFRRDEKEADRRVESVLDKVFGGFIDQFHRHIII